MGRPRRFKGRDINGVLLLDKPAGITSNEVLQRVKRLYQARKAGHTGSLDKPATGMLPLCFGHATRFSSYLLDSDKQYRTRARLGLNTTTADASGEITQQRDIPTLTEADIQRCLTAFIGETEQIPPMYSALKHEGQRLYKLAYQGVEVERKARKINIKNINLLNFSNDEFEIEVSCSKGTYIRTLVEDIGEKLDCGAHVLSLRRTGLGPYQGEDMVDFSELEKREGENAKELTDFLLPVDTALPQIPPIMLTDNVAYYLCLGQTVTATGAKEAGLVRLYNEQNQFLGLGESLADGRIKPHKLIKTQ